MIIDPRVQHSLVEQVLFAVRNGTKTEISEVLSEARQAARGVRDHLQAERMEFHQTSFDLGVTSTFVEMLSTSEQRSTLNDAVRTVKGTSKGREILREIAMCEEQQSSFSQGELASRVGEDAGNFNRKARRFVDVGLLAVRREGRTIRYSLTALGRDVLDELWDGWKADHRPISEIVSASASTALREFSRPRSVPLSSRVEPPLVVNVGLGVAVWEHNRTLSSPAPAATAFPTRASLSHGFTVPTAGRVRKTLALTAEEAR